MNGEHQSIGHFCWRICDPRKKFWSLVHWKSGGKNSPWKKWCWFGPEYTGEPQQIFPSAKAQSSKISGSLPLIQRVYITSTLPPLPEQSLWIGRVGTTSGMTCWGIRMILRERAKQQHAVIILRILNLKLEKFLSGKHKIFQRHKKRIWWLHYMKIH